MTKITFSLILLFTLLTTFNINAQIPAFPGAEGYGKYTVGGRGGQLIRVTNLNDSGPGSLREAIDAEGPRTVIFDVGGRINLSSTLTINNPYITIAGQHSVGDGITLSMEGTPNKFVMKVATDEVIIRYITIRRSSEKVSSQNSDCLYIEKGNNIIVDHCSMSWASDENLSIADYTTDSDTVGTQNITIQYNIITNAYGGNNKGTLVSDGPTRLTFWRNAWISSKTRNPAISTPTNSAANYDCYFELGNNIMYDYSTCISFNVNKPNSGVFYGNFLNNRGLQETGGGVSRKFIVFKTDNVEKAYLSGNITPLRPDDSYDQWAAAQHYNGLVNIDNPVPAYKRLDAPAPTPLITENVTLWDANDVWENLRTHVGASLPTRDSEDARAIADVDNGTQTYNNVSNTFPIITNGIPLVDEDNDGMPDFWETLEYGNFNSDGLVDSDGDGYTDLEEYLNQTANGLIPDVPAEDVVVTPSTATLNVPETINLSPTFIPANTTDKSGIWTSSDPAIATVANNGLVTSVSEGEAVITFTSNSGGFTDTVQITVTNIIIPLETVTVNPSDAVLEIGQNSQFTATLVPANTTDTSGTWSSSNDAVATVDENGLVTGVSEGEAVITYASDNTSHIDTSTVTVVDVFYGSYDFYNANTDELIQSIYGDTDINLENESNEVNFRIIPALGDQEDEDDPEVESVKIDWTGPTSGTYTESTPIYAGLAPHNEFDFQPYIVEAGTYNFTITFYAEDGGVGDVVAVDNFALTFYFSSLPIANAGSDQNICEGETTSLTASGGPNFLWDNGETTATIEVNPSTTTTYTVSVFDNLGNTDQDSVTITVNPIPTADAGEDQTICQGESITLAASGGTSYLWSTGETSETIEVSPIVETTYSVEVTSNSCTSTDDVVVFVNPVLDLTITENLVILEGESTTLTVGGSDNYEWSTSETAETIMVTPATTTTYTVTSLNSNGCLSYADVTVTVIPEIIANAGDDVTICSGETITLNATGGVTYTWDTGDTGAELTVSPTETITYSVTAEDDYGYTDTDTVTITVIESPTVTVDDDLWIMEGTSVTLTASGGVSYAWDTGETTETITVSPLATTTYTVTGFAENGCQNTAQVTVTVVEELNASAGEDVAICFGDSVTMNASGGTGYLWNTGDTVASPTFTPTETTTYSVTISDDFGNSDTDEVTVTVNSVPTADAGEDQTACAGEPTILTADGGDTYLWSTGETSASIVVNPTTDTTYTVEVFNSNNCSDTDDVTVFVNENPNVIVSDDVVIVLGESTTITAEGADSYVWASGATTASRTVSPATSRTYTVTGYSATGCQTTEQITVIVVPVVVANAGNDISICAGQSTTLSASGGVTYSWSNGTNGATTSVSPTQTTTYTVTATDNYGNSDEDSVTVTVNEVSNITVSENITIFAGQSTDLVANGGDTYLWNTGETTGTITVSPANTTTYTVTGSSGSNCEATAEVTVTVIAGLNADAGDDVSICLGSSVTLNASGGLTYIWNTGETGATPTVSPTETTTYTVTVTDNFGNTDSDSVTVTVNELPNITTSGNITIMQGQSVTLESNGAESYLWNTGDTTQNITVSPQFTRQFVVIGFSESGCQATSSLIVTVIPELNADAGVDVAICNGESVTLNASGGVTYTWNTGETGATPTVSPTETTTYTVTVSDGFGNTDTDSVTVTVNEAPNLSVTENLTIILGQSANLVATGSDNLIWNTGETTQSISVSPVNTTTYTVTGFSTNGCQVTLSVVVTVIPELDANAGADVTICSGQSVTLNASGGLTYTWNTGEIGATPTVSPNETTTYTVTVSDGEGNTDTDSVTIFVNPSPYVIIENGDNVEILNGDFITLSASGADTYEWSNGATLANIAVSPSQTTMYEVRGYVGNCYDEKQVTVNVIEPVEADAGEDVVICIDEVATLTATGGDEYLWNTGETTQTIIVSPTETTDYTVTVFNSLDFDEASVRVDVDPGCTSSGPIEPGDPLDFSFDVYPNPASDIVNVRIAGSLFVSDIYIFDFSGKLILQEVMANDNISLSDTAQINVSGLQEGIYFVKLFDQERSVTKKLIIKR